VLLQTRRIPRNNGLLFTAEIYSQFIPAESDVIKFFSRNPSIFLGIVSRMGASFSVMQAKKGDIIKQKPLCNQAITATGFIMNARVSAIVA
jgi:hypothetical protein